MDEKWFMPRGMSSICFFSFWSGMSETAHFRQTLLLTFRGSLLLMCLSLEIIFIHEMEAVLTHWYLIVRSIFEECATTTDTRSHVESICVPPYDPRPLMCLHAVQSHLSVGDFSGLFGDWPGAELWWRIVELMYLPPPCWQEAEAPSWSTGPHPSSRALFV